MVWIGDLDGKVRLLVAVDVALDEKAVRDRMREQLAAMSSEMNVGAKKTKGLVVGELGIGVDAGKVDPIGAILEVGDHVTGRLGRAAVLDRAVTKDVVL